MGTYILYFLFFIFPVENSGCEDSRSSCPTDVANGGNCLSTLGVTCKLSCNNCNIPDCGDYHTSCASWAAGGECTANPAYMLVSCKASCKVPCPPETTTTSVTTQQHTTSPPTTTTSLTTTTNPPSTNPPTTNSPTTNPPTTNPPTTNPPTTNPPTTAVDTPSTTETATLTSPTTSTTQAKETTTANSTTPITTQSPAEPITAANNVTTCKQHSCVRACRKPLFTFNTSDPDTLQMQIRSAIESIKTELKVNKTSLSSTIRTLTCASDDRPSSAAIGWLGAVLLGLVFGTIILADAVKLIAYIVS